MAESTGATKDLAETPEARGATPLIWKILKGDMEAQGHAKEAPMLPQVIKPVPVALKPEGKVKRVQYTMHQRLSDYSASYYSVSGEQRSWYFAALKSKPGDAMAKDEGIAIATKAARPPVDAQLETAEYDNVAGDPVFLVRWKHVINGTPVEKDYIQVLVNGATRKAFSLHRRWHNVDPQPKAR
jgi:hypothetical protein